MKAQTFLNTVNSLLFVLLIVFLMGVPAVDAATYYVATSGNDSNPGTSTQPWSTPAKAWSTAQAGDTVYFRSGTYTISSTVNAANSGTQTSPVTFAAYPGESVTLDASKSSVVPAFYIDKTYNVVDSLTLKSQGTFFSVGYNANANGFTLKNSTCIMTVGESDNAGCVKSYGGTNYVTVQNNTITGPGTGINANNAGIWFSYTEGAKAKNNAISGFPSGIYFKHANTVTDSGIELSYNYIYGCTWGIHSVANYAQIKNNILKSNTQNIYNGDDGGGGSGCKYDTISHNTVFGGQINFQNQGGTVGACQYNTLKDNIFMAENTYDAYDSTNLYMTSDYNLYPTGNIVYENGTHFTLTTWRTFLGQDGHSLSATPTFVGGSTPSSITGFALTSGSSGHAAASDGTDMGANASLVGPNAGQTTETPSSPTLQ